MVEIRNGIMFDFYLGLPHTYLFAHISDVKQTSDRHHEHRDERIANKHVSIVYSIQKNHPSTMADKISTDQPYHQVCQLLEKCMLAVYKYIIVKYIHPPAHIVYRGST